MTTSFCGSKFCNDGIKMIFVGISFNMQQKMHNINRILRLWRRRKVESEDPFDFYI